LSELQQAVKSLDCGQACGLDNMITEVLKLNEIHPTLLRILNDILLSKVPPSDWLTSILIPSPVFKKGSASECNNYRGIALMSIVSKLFNRLLADRLRIRIDKSLRYNQNGF
jgi:hypothetical protein